MNLHGFNEVNKPFGLITYIDRVNYENLLTANFTIDNIGTIEFRDNPNISQLTKGSIVYLNRQLSKLMRTSELLEGYYDSIVFLSDQEKKYIDDNFKDTFLKSNNNGPYNDKKYYEIVILPDNSLLVVVEEGFLTFVTDSKDNLLKFILDCLSYHYKYNFILSYLLKTYISLKLNDTYFNVVKARYF